MSINGLRLISNSVHKDERGEFVRVYDRNLVQNNFNVLQTNLSINPTAGTLRGMHFQVEGEPENKYIKLTSGSVYIAIVDLRKSESSYMNVYQGTLLAQDDSSIYIPAGCATGWISLVNNTSLLYFMSARYEESTFSGFRFDDPLIKIKWPRTPQLISEQDRNWPSLKIE